MEPLLGDPALEAFDVVKTNCANLVNSEEKTGTEYKQRYSKLFKGLGKKANEYKIHLKPDAKPLPAMYPEKQNRLLYQKLRLS